MTDMIQPNTYSDGAEVDDVADVVEAEPTGRRRLIAALAGAAAVGATGAVLGQSGVASANDGDPIVIGTENQLAQSPTELKGQAGITGKHVLLVNDQTGFNDGNSGSPAALAAWSQSRHGAYLWTNASATDQSALMAFAVSGTGITARGAHAAMRFVGVGGVPAADTVDHTAGEIRFDTDENLWVCVVSGNPGTWRKIQGPATAGALHPIDPIRAYDSRQAAYASNGPLAPNASRVVSVADAHSSTGVVTVADAVPAGASAITYNVTVAAPTGSNFLSVAPGDAVSFTASSVNFTAGQNVANGLTGKLDGNRQVKVFCGDGPGSCHFIIDVNGYYL